MQKTKTKKAKVNTKEQKSKIELKEKSFSAVVFVTILLILFSGIYFAATKDRGFNTSTNFIKAIINNDLNTLKELSTVEFQAKYPVVLTGKFLLTFDKKDLIHEIELINYNNNKNLKTMTLQTTYTNPKNMKSAVVISEIKLKTIKKDRGFLVNSMSYIEIKPDIKTPISNRADKPTFWQEFNTVAFIALIALGFLALFSYLFRKE